MHLPSYRLHKPTGQAIVVFSQGGKRQFHYLGKYGSPESHAKYERLIGTYLAAGRQAPTPQSPQTGVALRQLAAAYLSHAENYYRHSDGTSTGEIAGIRAMLKWLNEHAGDTHATSFTPAVFKAIRDKLVTAGDSRGYINQQAGRMIRMVKWGVENELVEPEVWQRLKAVSPLKKGRTDAKERPPIPPVPEEQITATLEHLPDDVADMVRLQRYTGMRPGELWQLRPCDVERSRQIWRYTPPNHKTAWRCYIPRSGRTLWPFLAELCL